MRGQVADSEQVLRDKMAIIRGSRAFGVDTPITPQLTGDEGGETPCSEYSLHFKCPWGWAGVRLSWFGFEFVRASFSVTVLGGTRSLLCFARQIPSK